MTYTEAKAHRDQIEASLKAANAKLTTYPRNAIGLTPDGIKFTAQYQADKAAVDTAFAQLRAFNGKFTTIFAKEIRAERAARAA